MTQPDPRIPRHYATCDAECNRGGESSPCGKPAVAFAMPDDFGVRWWPVCAFHARARAMVALPELLAEARR